MLGFAAVEGFDQIERLHPIYKVFHIFRNSQFRRESQLQLQVAGDVEAMHLVWSRPSTIHHREARTKIWRSMVGLMESFSKTSHHKVHLGALDTFQGHGYMACISICCIVDGVPWLEVMDSALEATAVPIKV
jgi:hypothetical protein